VSEGDGWAGKALAQALHQLARVASLEADTLEGGGGLVS
jgi:hypothetical protein